jgi:hypothetical protein
VCESSPDTNLLTRKFDIPATETCICLSVMSACWRGKIGRFDISQAVLCAELSSHRYKDTRIPKYLTLVDVQLPDLDPTHSDMPHTHMHIKTQKRRLNPAQNDHQKCQVWRCDGCDGVRHKYTDLQQGLSSTRKSAATAPTSRAPQSPQHCSSHHLTYMYPICNAAT